MQNTKNNLQVVRGLLLMLIVGSIKSLMKQGTVAEYAKWWKDI